MQRGYDTSEQRARRWRRVVFAIHLTLYVVALLFVFMVSVISSGSFSSMSHTPAFFMLLWSPVMMVHLAMYIHNDARERMVGDDREAYREGFRDAVRMLRVREGDDGVFERLGLDDEGELVPLNNKRKR